MLKKALVILLFFSSTLTNMNAEVLRCSDSDVKQLVIEITIEEFQNQLMKYTIPRMIGTSYKYQGRPTYNQWNSVKHENPKINKVITYIDNIMKEVNPQLSAIRTESINHKIGRIECLADITLINGDDTTSAISYDAQYTDDEYIYVNVYGLN